MSSILIDLIIGDFAGESPHIFLRVLPQQFGEGCAVQDKYGPITLEHILDCVNWLLIPRRDYGGEQD